MDTLKRLYEQASAGLIKARITQEANNRGLSLAGLCRKLGKTRVYFTVYFSKDQKPPLNTLIEAAKILGIPPQNLISEMKRPTVDFMIPKIVARCRDNEEFCELCYNLSLTESDIIKALSLILYRNK